MDPQSIAAPRAYPARCSPLPRTRAVSPPTVLPTLSAALVGALRAESQGRIDWRSDDDALLDRFLDLLAGGDSDTIQAVIDQLVAAGIRADDVLLGLLTPAAQRLGELWEEDARSFVDVTVATGKLQQLLHRILSRSPAPTAGPNAPRILLVTPTGEDHTFGALLFHAVLRFRGWAVVPVAPFWSRVEAGLRDSRVVVLGVSVGSERSLSAARSTIRRARACAANPSLVVLVGGALAATAPDRVSPLGADGVAGDAETALDLLQELVPQRYKPEFQA